MFFLGIQLRFGKLLSPVMLVQRELLALGAGRLALGAGWLALGAE